MKHKATRITRSSSKQQIGFQPSMSLIHADKSNMHSLKTFSQTNFRKQISLVDPMPSSYSNKNSLFRVATMNFDSRKPDQSKAKQLEDLLYDRLEKLNSNQSNWNSEIEVLDSIYKEISIYFNSFGRIFMMLRQKYEENFTKFSNLILHEKLQKTKKKNENLLSKLNTLNLINSQLLSENEKLKKDGEDYERLFKSKPEILINYTNIIDKMLDQCKTIDELKKEVKVLKRAEILSAKMITELKLQIRHQDSASLLDITDRSLT